MLDDPRRRFAWQSVGRIDDQSFASGQRRQEVVPFRRRAKFEYRFYAIDTHVIVKELKVRLRRQFRSDCQLARSGRPMNYYQFHKASSYNNCINH